MREPVNDHMSWSIGMDASSADRAFEELVELSRELLLDAFPPARGFEAAAVRLHGPIEGVRWRVTRGPFGAELGLQRFVRAHAAGRPEAAIELRLVASAGHCDVDALDPESRERRVVLWAMTGWGLGSVALGALLLGASGTLAGWAQALLLVPAAAAWRASVSGLVRRASRPPRALPGGHARALPAATGSSPRVEDGLERWRRLLPVLRAQRDRLERTGGLAPFREQALHAETLPSAVGVRALAAGSSLTPVTDGNATNGGPTPTLASRPW